MSIEVGLAADAEALGPSAVPPDSADMAAIGSSGRRTAPHPESGAQSSTTPLMSGRRSDVCGGAPATAPSCGETGTNAGSKASGKLDEPRAALAAIALAVLIYGAFLFTLRLKYAEWIVLRTFCPWCAISAVSITLLGILVALELRRTRRPPVRP